MGILLSMIWISFDFGGKSALLAVGSPHTESPSDRQSQCKQVNEDTGKNSDNISPHILSPSEINQKWSPCIVYISPREELVGKLEELRGLSYLVCTEVPLWLLSLVFAYIGVSLSLRHLRVMRLLSLLCLLRLKILLIKIRYGDAQRVLLDLHSTFPLTYLTYLTYLHVHQFWSSVPPSFHIFVICCQFKVIWSYMDCDDE